MSIRIRLLLLVFAVWLPAAAAFGLFAWQTYDREMAQARAQVEQLAIGVGSALERELDKRAVLSRALAASTAVRAGDFVRFHADARQATEAGGDWATLVDPLNHIANTLAAYPASPVKRAVPMALTGDSPMTLFIPKGAVAQQSVVSVFSGVPDVSPQAYNVGVSFSPQVVQDLLDRFTVPLGGVAAIVDRQHLLIARSRDAEKWLGQASSADIQARIQQNLGGFADSTTLDGIQSLTYVSKANAYGWAVVVAMPKAALSLAATRVTTQALTAAGVLLLFGLALALYGAQGLGNVVTQLRRAANDLGDGQSPAALRSGIVEVDAVSAALHDAGAKLRDANQSLERRVDEAVAQARQAQASLLDSQRHEVIGRLTAGIAHDFNNLLQTVSTALHMLKPHATSQAQRKPLEGAARAIVKASDLVKQLLTFGKAQTLEPAAVDLGDLVLKSRDLTAKAVGERIVLTASVEPGLPPVFVDPVQLELALLNLVFNARDAIGDSGHIAIKGRFATSEEAAGLEGDQFVRLEVCDDGVGMPEEVRDRVFEPYFTTKPVGKGTGLGLAQVHAFAQQSGGDVGIVSVAGRGTTVGLTLPIATQVPDAVPEARPAAARRQALHILMVEDDVLVSSLVESALQGEGHRVQLCHTADEAVEVLRGGAAFDVLFTDVMMPGKLNGMDLVEWCQQHRPGLPAVVATGYAERLSETSVPVLRKPYDLDAMLDALQSAHQLHTA